MFNDNMSEREQPLSSCKGDIIEMQDGSEGAAAAGLKNLRVKRECFSSWVVFWTWTDFLEPHANGFDFSGIDEARIRHLK